VRSGFNGTLVMGAGACLPTRAVLYRRRGPRSSRTLVSGDEAKDEGDARAVSPAAVQKRAVSALPATVRAKPTRVATRPLPPTAYVCSPSLGLDAKRVLSMRWCVFVCRHQAPAPTSLHRVASLLFASDGKVKRVPPPSPLRSPSTRSSSGVAPRSDVAGKDSGLGLMVSEVLAWGWNGKAQCGTGTKDACSHPKVRFCDDLRDECCRACVRMCLCAMIGVSSHSFMLTFRSACTALAKTMTWKRLWYRLPPLRFIRSVLLVLATCSPGESVRCVPHATMAFGMLDAALTNVYFARGDNLDWVSQAPTAASPVLQMLLHLNSWPAFLAFVSYR